MECQNSPKFKKEGSTSPETLCFAAYHGQQNEPYSLSATRIFALRDLEAFSRRLSREPKSRATSARDL